MQSAKDSFYLALRDRLARLAPARTVVVDGVERPAVLVQENEPLTAAPALPNAYYLAWGAPQIVAGSEASPVPLLKTECCISYRAAAASSGGVDRGRALAAMDSELLRLLTPARTAKLDCARSPLQALGTFVFWGTPVFDEAKTRADLPGFARAGEQNALTRTAHLSVFFFPEVQA